MANGIIVTDKPRYNIRDIIDIDELKSLFENYSDITGMTTALLDLEGNVLIATNWQNSCTQFHRTNAITRDRCHESDTALAGALKKGDNYNVYQCRNGLVDIATPIIINGFHMANFFTGQFFFKPPDMAYFSRQADELGFEKAAYLAAIREVPVYDHGTIQRHMTFLVQMAEMIGRMGLANLQVQETNRELELHRTQLQALVEARTAELSASLKSAETANKAKSTFLANMSHELRTPLNAVLGFSEILQTKETDPQKKHYLKAINQAGSGLLDLINSVLDLSKIESGKMPVQPQPMAPRDLLNEVQSIFERLAAEKELALNVSVAPEVPEVIEFDRGKLRQVLINLVANGIKFTDAGSVNIQMSAERSVNEPDYIDIRFSVIDTGKGIAKADHERIFKAFEQAQGQKISDYGGTGLGLALVRQWITLLGGDLWVESEAGRGSAFTFRFTKVLVLPASRRFDAESNNPSSHQTQTTRFIPTKRPHRPF